MKILITGAAGFIGYHTVLKVLSKKKKYPFIITSKKHDRCLDRIYEASTKIKNINSFRNVQKAIESEIIRQNNLLNNGNKVEQATLTWNNDKNTAEIMRLKENADDYRYFNDPDLPPVDLDDSIIDNIMSETTILPYDYSSINLFS